MKALTLTALILAFIVIILGAYVRLQHSGLGCPDWPGCYGHLTVPEAHEVDDSYTRPLEPAKAWKEMTHRYMASVLGFCVLALAIVSLKRKLVLPWVLLTLVIFQALLGMWTVTLKLHPLVVMLHLLGGFGTLGLLWWILLTLRRGNISLKRPDGLAGGHRGAPLRRLFVLIALFALIAQIALGGWTSANYASLACPDFPTCQTHWWPPMDLKGAFGLWHDFGKDYEGGVLFNEARMTIHWFHRLGALLNFFVLGFVGSKLLKRGNPPLKTTGAFVLGFLVCQILLGISNVVFTLPLPVAVAHNGTAALLLLSVLTALFYNAAPPKTS